MWSHNRQRRQATGLGFPWREILLKWGGIGLDYRGSRMSGFGMSLLALLVSGLALSACSNSMGDRFLQDTSRACSQGDRLACESLVTLHPQAVRDADAIMQGMQHARMEREAIQRATQ